MEFRNGMNEVYTPDLGIQPVANIILIHGLFGNPWKTFAVTSREAREATGRDNVSSHYSPAAPTASLRKSKGSSGIYWPRDFFGYDADVEKFMSATGLNTVHHHGRNLLNALSDLLKEHGALNQSAHSCDAERSKVLQMTRGVIFLGTPHRGSSAATYGRMVFKLTKMFAFQNANVNLISSDFDCIHRTLAKAQNLKLWSFAEEKQMRLGLIGTHIVPPESARIGHERENWGTISGDHRRIAKYFKATEEGFVKVSSVLKGWIDEAILTDQECLRSLNEPEARIRLGEVSQASRVNKGSFEWLFTDRVAYSEWLADDGYAYDPIFWITGKPGSGKSTLMRFALEDPRSESLLPPSIGRPMAYFFHLRGKSLVQKSLQGMIQELLYQILEQFPDFFVSLKPVYERAVLKTGSGVKWGLEDLIEGFRLIADLSDLSMRGRPRIFLFVDALDENQDQKDNVKLLQVLREIVERYQARKKQPGTPLLKICLASRPWPSFHSAFGGRSRIPTISVNNFTTSDIKRYTQSLLLSPLSGIQYSEQYRSSVTDLAEQIASRAKGVFHIVDGTPVNGLNDILSRYPTELDELYEHTIRRIPKEYRRETEVALKVVQHSRIQLNLGELYSICSICIGSADPGDTEIPYVPAMSHAGSVPHKMDAGVQFIHQTVQDFVRQGIFFDYLRDIEQAIDLAPLTLNCKPQPLLASPRTEHYISSHKPVQQGSHTNILQDAFDIRAHHPSAYDMVFRRGGANNQSTPPIYKLNANSNSIPECILALVEDYMPILQNLYYFGAKWFTSSHIDDLSIVAALGLRLSASRIDRPRMLSRVLSSLPQTMNYKIGLQYPRELLLCNKFIPILDLRRPILLITILVSAIPNEDIDERTLLKMTEIVLASGARTDISVQVRVPFANLRVAGLSLLNFIVRFKEGRQEAWINLLRRYGASLYDQEFEWTNQRALSASQLLSRVCFGSFAWKFPASFE
ncbi:hypothetical protein GGR55DRAFT_689298 [Xylaria sp. FL0064]|nr:hypothetical protein GGR55DRAFT_689298 [Xylaria sp. FL0064]